MKILKIILIIAGIIFVLEKLGINFDVKIEK